MNPNYSGDEVQGDDADSLFLVNVEDAADYQRVEDIKEDMDHDRTAISIKSEFAQAIKPTLVSREDMNKDDPRIMDATANAAVPDPTPIIGAMFPVDTETGVQRAVVKEELNYGTGYLVELKDGKTKVVEYNLIMDALNEPEDDESDNYCTFSDIMGHQKRKEKWEVKVK